MPWRHQHGARAGRSWARLRLLEQWGLLQLWVSPVCQAHATAQETLFEFSITVGRGNARAVAENYLNEKIPRMDLVLMFYWALVLMGGVYPALGPTSAWKPITWKARSGKTQIFPYIIPECLRRAMLRLLHFLFHTRNHTIILHLILQGMVYTEYTGNIWLLSRAGLLFVLPSSTLSAADSKTWFCSP